ncbi:hypothetical protein [Lentzea sp. NPDC060358]|uniref:hypothetical protein n=1 Tax=Lentzea sp. NPDC060358 TaxID=3347103 RepID=UPI0036490ED3
MDSVGASYRPALIEALNDAFRLAGEAVELLVDNFDKGIHNINTNPLVRLAPDLFGRLEQAVDELREYVDAFVKVMLGFLKHHAPVVALVQAGFDWLTVMQKPVSDMAARAGDQSGNKNFGQWTGPAAQHYHAQVLARQQKALDQFAPKAEAVSKWLVQIAQTNIKLLNTYADRIGNFVAKAVSAVVSAGTIIGALEAIGDAAEICGELIASAVTVFGDSVEHYTTVVASMREMYSTRTSNSAFPDECWPRAVT